LSLVTVEKGVNSVSLPHELAKPILSAKGTFLGVYFVNFVEKSTDLLMALIEKLF
jgi:hypothetical protein